MSKRIAIIGAGIAGLTAAQKLFANGFTEVIVLEAMDRIGGRIHTIPFEKGVLELGAQWIHGQDGNPLYRFAKENNLLSNPELDFGIEGEGLFCTDSGVEVDQNLVNDIIAFLDQIKNDMTDRAFNSDEILSAEQIFREKFIEYIKCEKCPLSDTQLLWSLFNWYIKFEIIDNSCNDLNDLSLLSYTEWQECEGIDLINLKNGYQTLIDSILNDIPKNVVLLEKPINRIEIKDEIPNVYLFTDKDKSPIVVDHVIITSSLGYLQKNMDTFFGFSVPYKKLNTIKSLGFGTINKIYLFFDQPFWRSDDKGFQLIWTKKHDSFPFWVYDISGFDVVRGQPNVLVAWIGANGAQEMEMIDSDHSVGIICANVLRLFLHNIHIENPSKVIRSKWSTNEYICGSYSNRTIEYQKKNCDIECFSEPIVMTKQWKHSNESIDWPLVLFAGEATDKEFYSTTHGAFRSGHREANRLITFYRNLDNYKSNELM